MQRTLDLIKTASVPATVLRLAARGALAVPAMEMVEIMVYLATHSEDYGDQCTRTLMEWDEAASIKVAGNPDAPKEILDYWINPQNLRSGLLPALIENPYVSEAALEKIARAVSGASLDVLLDSARVGAMPAVIKAVGGNLNLNAAQKARVREMLPAEPEPETPPPAQVSTEEPEAKAQPSAEQTVEAPLEDPTQDPDVSAFLKEHAAEVAQEGDKPFQPLGGIHEDISSDEPEAADVVAPDAAGPVKQRGSTLQKIALLNITGRIQLAMKGTKEERSLLIRDGTKLVALAVLESPKISDGEVEKFAGQKNVLEAVLRQIPMKRRFAKNYNVVRNLVANPRVPLDVALGLMKNILPADLKALSGNKEVSETIRKLALRQFKQKTEKKN
jgi:hypothetical protein